MKNYDPSVIEPKWQQLWTKAKVYEADIKSAKNPYYNLWMFPYPSGARMHVGHAYASTGADIHGRFMRMNSKTVFQPMGFDAFGIHGENYAIKVGRHPKELVDELCDRYRDEQFKRMGHGYDWSHEVRTYEPEYYKWTQWIFLKLYKAGLAVRKEASVNWCPSCKTVLADEQVIQGYCERCETLVEQRELKQWFFKITEYADRLLGNLEKIDWPQRIKVMQRNWIGRSEGAVIKFEVVGGRKEKNSSRFIPVFTTRPDTLFGATFFVLAPESKWVEGLVTEQNRKKVEDYVKKAKSLTMQQRVQQEEKTGVFTGGFVVNPATGKEIPVFIADYVLFEYGGGAVMGVPAHDQRDFEFAKNFSLPIIEVVTSERAESDLTEAYEGEGVLVNSGQFSGMSSTEAKKVITEWLLEKGLGEAAVEYKLRDWCISRQRYWAAPIPIIYCEKCGEVPVPEEELPVLLPDTESWRPTGTEKSPLAAIDEFVNTICPYCKGPALRETDVCDNFLDSAWYYYAYPVYSREVGGRTKMGVPIKSAPDYPFRPGVVKKWLPVDMYVGGAEHSVLHLMYTRFITMVFKDVGLIDFDEPFKTFFAHGLITKDGAKMSKSKGNIVNPDEYIERVGADAFRTYLMFLGPYDAGGDFTDSGLQGVVRFLKRVWTLAKGRVDEELVDKRRLQLMHQTIRKVTEDIRTFSFNTAIAALMEWVKKISNTGGVMTSSEVASLLKLLAPFAPHITEELWQEMSGWSETEFSTAHSIHLQPWPKFDSELAQAERVTIIVQVNGKLRDRLLMARGVGVSEVKRKALDSRLVSRHLQGKKVRKVIFVPDKLINFVV